MVVFLRSCLTLTLTLLASAALASPIPGQVDDFSSGTTAGWTSDSAGVTAVPDAGPAGVGDTAAQISAGQGGQIAAFNTEGRWLGDWTASGIYQLRVDLRNTGGAALAVRIAFESGPDRDTDYVVTEAQAVPADGGWAAYTFDVVAATLSGPADPAATLAAVTELRIQHDTDGVNPPDIAAGVLLFDNLSALGDSCGNGLLGPGELCDGADVGDALCAQLPGFDGGILTCDPSSACQGYDTALCTRCGDGACEADGGETALTCADDCTSCGDGVASGAELCDGADLNGESCASLGEFDGGTLACADGCGLFDTSACTRCGDGACEGDESAQSCPLDCTVCGDGVITGAEVCEPTDLDGESCTSLGFDSGALACASGCGGFDSDACTRCGDGACEGAETLASCADDCTTCGDAVCAGDETPVSCGADCPTRCGDGIVSGAEECDWGEAGALLDRFTSSDHLRAITGIATYEGDRLIYLADSAANAIHRVDADTGAYADGAPFITPLGAGIVDVALGPDGDLCVVAEASNRVEIYDRQSGIYLSAFPLGGGLLRPEAIDFKRAERLAYVVSARDDAGQLQAIAEINLVNGWMVGDFGDARGEHDLAFGPGGDLFTIQGTAIVRFAHQGGGALGPWVDAAPHLDAVRRLSFARDGSLFLLGTHGGTPLLAKYDALGAFVGTFGGGELALGAGLGVGLDGRLLAPGLDPSPTRPVALARFNTGNSDASADSCRETCVDPRCGDGTIDSGEGCDDGDPAGGDGCAACALEAGWVCDGSQRPNACFNTCGDGILDPLEGCDDGDLVSGDGCSASCALEAGWSCAAPSAGLPSVCQAAECGDGIIAGAEECEDLNTLNGDGCTSCRLDDGWVCDASVTPNTCAETCGDGGPDPLEACDDGGLEDGDGCSANCEIELGWQCTPTREGSPAFCVAAACGDGLTVDDEACDDGNIDGGDGCSACRIDPGWICEVPAGSPSRCAHSCGDGLSDELEECDDGNIDDGDGCSTHCAVERGWACTPASAGAPSQCEAAACGDGITAGDEECDDGDLQPHDGCSACQADKGWVCRTAFVPSTCFETCGDGGPDPLEACDDGNELAGDGCSPNCAVETGWECAPATLQAPSTCHAAACGDGIVTGDERCDDGNATAGDGCTACAPDPGFICDTSVEPSSCQATCGDGDADPLEACDDGNTDEGDGCSPNCEVEEGWACGPAPSSCGAAVCGDLIIAGDEECEDGDATPGDGCTACRVDPGWVCNIHSLPNPCFMTCGDGTRDSHEACDDGNTDEGDGCSDNCAIEPGWSCAGGACQAIACGDGIAAGDERCDDANGDSGDGCDGCALEAGWVCDLSVTPSACAQSCGDGALDALEACDDGNIDEGDGCSPSCEIEAGWACEEATASAPSACGAARCGDGIIAGDEGCDFGDDAPGDGCGALCLVETGWTCDGEGCAPTCGDGLRLGDEGCDDGDDDAGDGCDGCEIEEGWSCTTELGQLSACVELEVCGDGKKGASEACEDGNTRSGDGCSPTCEVEPDWSCDAEGCTPDDDDGDGLSNIDERALGTLVDDDDSDDDGLLDGDEVTRGTDPLDADTDHDGLSDGLEVERGFDPKADNSDGDRLLDGEDNCPGVTNPDQQDLDQDGVGDLCDPTPGTRDPFTLSGGEGCQGGGGVPLGGALWALLGAALWSRRRRGASVER